MSSRSRRLMLAVLALALATGLASQQQAPPEHHHFDRHQASSSGLGSAVRIMREVGIVLVFREMLQYRRRRQVLRRAERHTDDVHANTLPRPNVSLRRAHYPCSPGRTGTPATSPGGAEPPDERKHRH